MDDLAYDLIPASTSPDDAEVARQWIPLASSQSETKDRMATSGQVEEALRQAHKMAIVGQMAGGLAHDFNNLLQGVVGALDVMHLRIHQGRTEELARPLDIAYMSLNRAADLTHRLLAFSRPHAVELKCVNVNATITSMQALLRCTLGPRVQVDLQLADGLGNPSCDLHQLENVLLNLAINAKDAMPEGGRLLIETFTAYLRSERTETRQGRYVGICVADSGTGMAPEIAERAFEPFYTTKPAGRGTGLGLAMTRHFVEQCNGRANIESVLGQGTSILLYLPCASDDEHDTPVALAGAQAA